jgi:hypothetical protein
MCIGCDGVDVLGKQQGDDAAATVARSGVSVEVETFSRSVAPATAGGPAKHTSHSASTAGALPTTTAYLVLLDIETSLTYALPHVTAACDMATSQRAGCM